MSESTYSGWANYPTWAVNLWLANDEGLYSRAVAMVGECKDVGELSTAYRDWVTDELSPDLGASFVADLYGYALGEVDWYEIAESWWNDHHEEDEEDEEETEAS